jgi:hypothetical protein
MGGRKTAFGCIETYTGIIRVDTALELRVWLNADAPAASIAMLVTHWQLGWQPSQSDVALHPE